MHDSGPQCSGGSAAGLTTIPQLSQRDFVTQRLHLTFRSGHYPWTSIDGVTSTMPTLYISAAAPPSQALPVLLLSRFLNQSYPRTNIAIEYTRDSDDNVHTSKLRLSKSIDDLDVTDDAVLPALVSITPDSKQYADELVNTWTTRCRYLLIPDYKALRQPFQRLDSELTLRSFVKGQVLTPLDLVIYGAIRGNRFAAAAARSWTNVTRWMNFIDQTCPWIQDVLDERNKHLNRRSSSHKAVDSLADVAARSKERPIVTRFPPEPSGYLHIGHAKAALLNYLVAHNHGGTMICRFDDTNPAKESQEFQASILVDLAAIGVVPDRVTFSSDYFEQMHNACANLIMAGKAYADNTPQQAMKHQRWNGLSSSRRNTAIDHSLACFRQMQTGSEQGQQYCIRAKISIDDPNKSMRDPVIFRCNNTPHHRTGTKWKAYPTYDFAAPFVDAIEGVTLALRTTEYNDRNAQYAWLQQAMNLRPVPVWEFSRLSFVRTVMSKRKLAELIDLGAVAGWDDPRMPTVRGVLRRGLIVPALRDFIIEQGPSRNIVALDWSTIWAMNKKVINPTAPRHVVVLRENAVQVSLDGKSNTLDQSSDIHADGIVNSDRLIIDQLDAASLAEGEKITLMNWGNAIVTAVHRQDKSIVITSLDMVLTRTDDVRNTKKITWLSADRDLVSVRLHTFGDLILKDKLDKTDDIGQLINWKSETVEDAWADPGVASLHQGDIIQFDRYGFYRLDRQLSANSPAAFFKIPTGRSGS